MAKKIIFTVLTLFIWLIIFCLGAFINTNPLRESLHGDFRFTDFLIIVLAWIPTNLAILSILSGILGAMGKTLLLEMETVRTIPAQNATYRAFKGAIAGFVLYLVLLAGTVLMIEKPFETTTPEQYFRISGVNALIAFLAGYRPEFLRKTLARD
jgi:hypothetical protein